MLIYRPSGERGHVTHGWLDTRHTFSFDSYHNAQWTRFSNLRVINEDRVQPDSGFGTHPHYEMEIITYMVAGKLTHHDSMGHAEVLKAGEVQVMSAGSGLTHSEYNASDTMPLHLLQIWVFPNERGVEPRYDQRSFPPTERTGQLKLLVAPFNADAPEDALRIHADFNMFGAVLEKGSSVAHTLADGRSAWVQVISGEVTADGKHLAAGDGLGATEEQMLKLTAGTDCELLLFDLAPTNNAR